LTGGNCLVFLQNFFGVLLEVDHTHLILPLKNESNSRDIQNIPVIENVKEQKKKSTDANREISKEFKYLALDTEKRESDQEFSPAERNEAKGDPQISHEIEMKDIPAQSNK